MADNERKNDKSSEEQARRERERQEEANRLGREIINRLVDNELKKRKPQGK